MDAKPIVALVLSGGNALGAYHAGAYEALHRAGWLPDWVVGASAGALNGALICGAPPEERVARLRAFWRPAPEEGAAATPRAVETARRTAAATSTLTMGQPGLFSPRWLHGPWWDPPGLAGTESLFDTAPLHATLDRLVDFDRLNRGDPRLCVTAVDVESGEDVVVDTRVHRLRGDHVRASSALLPAFPAVEVDGRLLADAGIALNLPLDVVLGDVEDDRPLLCIAVDLLPLRGPRPRTIGDAVNRVQDLLFAAQSRRALAAWQAVFDERARAGMARSVTLVHLQQGNAAQDVSGKAFDFSPSTVGARWRAGRADLAAALASIGPARLAEAAPGLRVFARGDDPAGGFAPVHHRLAPRPA